MVSVSSEKEVLEVLRRGSKNRSVSATNMNDQSSRSHLILSCYVLARNNVTGKDTLGKMHLIDLSVKDQAALALDACVASPAVWLSRAAFFLTSSPFAS